MEETKPIEYECPHCKHVGENEDFTECICRNCGRPHPRLLIERMDLGFKRSLYNAIRGCDMGYVSVNRVAARIQELVAGPPCKQRDGCNRECSEKCQYHKDYWKPSARRSAKFLLEKFENKSCDCDGVSHCIRCNVVAQSKRMLELLAD